jgi:hypothetical protein
MNILFLKNSEMLVFLGSILLLLSLESCNRETPTEQKDNSLSGTVSLHDQYLDLDGNGKIDYRFAYYAWTTNSYPNPDHGMGVEVDCIDSNQVQNSPLTGTQPMKDSVLISDTSGWNRYSEGLAGSSNFTYWSGPFVKDTSQNLGLRLYRQGLYYYGWVKLSITHDGKLWFLDSAYSSIANKPILAGVHP